MTKYNNIIKLMNFQTNLLLKALVEQGHILDAMRDIQANEPKNEVWFMKAPCLSFE